MGLYKMSNQPRMLKVLLVLVVAMTSGTAVLIALGNNAPSGSLFSLSAYRQLGPIENSLASLAPQQTERWNSIEIYYSRTAAGNIAQLASLEGLVRTDDLNCHFCLCNGKGGTDGMLEPTEKWQNQWSCVKNQNWYGNPQTIRVCVIADGQSVMPTDNQRRRVTEIVETLCRKFSIQTVYLPSNWQ